MGLSYAGGGSSSGSPTGSCHSDWVFSLRPVALFSYSNLFNGLASLDSVLGCECFPVGVFFGFFCSGFSKYSDFSELWSGGSSSSSMKIL